MIKGQKQVVAVQSVRACLHHCVNIHNYSILSGTSYLVLRGYYSLIPYAIFQHA